MREDMQMLSKKIIAFISLLMLIFALLIFSIKATSEQSEVLLSFNKTSFTAGEIIELTVYVNQTTDFYGFQIDLTDNNQPYDVITTSSKYFYDYTEIFSNSQDQIWMNGYQDHVATLIVTRHPDELLGYSVQSIGALGSISLLATEDIEDIYELFDVSEDYLDLELGLVELSVKLSDSNGNPILWQYAIDNVAPTINPLDSLIIRLGDPIPNVLSTIVVSDNYDISPILRTNIDDIVNNEVVGVYMVDITAFDLFGNTSSISVSVTVIDDIAPIISLNGESSLVVEYGSTYVDQGAIVTDNYDQNLSYTVQGIVDTTQLGIYTITFSAVDSNGNHAVSIVRTVTVVNSYPKASILPGIDTIEVGEEHIDAGISVNYAGTYSITVIDTVDPQNIGEYTITYTVNYENGTVRIVRYVFVIADSPIVIFELAPALTTLFTGVAFIDTGCQALVNDEIIPCTIHENNINTSIAGVYTVIYGVTINEILYTHTRYVMVLNLVNSNLAYFKREEENI
jgi:hypothetical protein